MARRLFSFLFLVLSLLTSVSGQGVVTAPSSGTVWTNGGEGQISWSNLAGTSFSIVLNRINTVYHHTITSTAANTGSYVWDPIDIPGQDGWPPSSSTDMVYQIDFYVGGGWNSGGTLVAQSSPFAIIWDDPSTPGVVTVPLQPGDGYITTTRTIVVLGCVTTTVYVPEVCQSTYPVVGSTVVDPAPQTVTITNTAQLNTITQAVVVGTTIGGGSTNSPQPELYNSGTVKSTGSSFASLFVGVMFWYVLLFV